MYLSNLSDAFLLCSQDGKSEEPLYFWRDTCVVSCDVVIDSCCVLFIQSDPNVTSITPTRLPLEKLIMLSNYVGK